MLVTSIGISPHIFQYFHQHEHDEWEITVNLEGEGHVLMGGRQYAYGPGTILCCPPKVPHTKFSKNGFRDAYLLPSVFPLAAALKEQGCLVFQDDAEKSFETLMLMALRVYHKREDNYGALADSLFETMNQLLVQLAAWIAGRKGHRADQKHAGEILCRSRFCRYAVVAGGQLQHRSSAPAL